MLAMGFILTKAVKKAWKAQIGLAAGPDGRCGATGEVFGKSTMLSKDLHFRLHGTRPCAYNSEAFMAITLQVWLLLVVKCFAADDHVAGESR